MLDTNAASELIRNPAGRVAQRVRGGAGIALSIIVAAELRFGSVRRGSARLTKAMEEVFDLLPVLPFEPPADQVYGELRRALEATGTTLDANDLLIAAHALTLDRVLVTDDRAFLRVPELVVENWLR